MDKQQIAERAYQLWETEGRPYGRDLEHWFQAETDVKQTAKKPAGRAGRGGKAASGGTAVSAKKPAASRPSTGSKKKA